MNPTPHHPWLAAFLAVFPGVLLAQAPVSEPAIAPDAVDLGPVVVTATRHEQPVAEAPASITVLDPAWIESRHVERVGDILRETPSLYLWGSSLGSAPPTAARGRISLRGIPGASRTLVLIDNQPLNDAYLGNVNWSSIFMEDVDRIEVLPGAASALYGGNAYAGVIHVITKAPQQRRFFVKGGYEFGGPDSAYGSFVYHDKLTNGFGISVGYRYEQSSGFEDTKVVKSPTAGAPGTNLVSGWTRTTTTTGAPAYLIGDIGKQPWNYHSTQARLFYDFSADSRVNAGISYFRSDVDIDDPNTYLRDATGRPVTTGILDIDGRRIAITPRDFVANGPAHDDVLRTFANWDHAFTEDVRLQAGVSYADRDYRFTSPGATAHADGGLGSLTAAPTTGLDAYTQLTTALGDRNELTAGVSFNRGELDRESWNLRDWRDLDALSTRISASTGVNRTYAGFLQDQFKLHDRVTLYLGGRLDAWSTEGGETTFTATNSAGTDFGDHSELQFSPRGAAVFDLWEGGTLKGSAGTAFRSPTLFDLYVTSRRGTTASFSNPNLSPEKSLSWEVGLGQQFKSGTHLQLTYFHSDLQDLIYNRTLATGPGGTTNQIINAGAAIAQGIEFVASQELSRWARLQVGYTHTASEVIENRADPASEGKRLTSSPRHLFTVGLDAEYKRWSGSLVGKFTDEMFDTSQNTDVIHNVYGGFEAFWMLDAKIGWRPAEWCQLTFSINNVAGERYYQFIDNPGRTYALEFGVQF